MGKSNVKMTNPETERNEALQQEIERLKSRIRILDTQVSSPDIFFEGLMNMCEGFWLVDPDGQFVKVSKSAAEELGYTQDELVGKSVKDIDINFEPEKIKKRIDRVYKDGSFRFQTRHRRKDETVLDVEVLLTQCSHPACEDHIMAFTRDISNRVMSASLIDDQREHLAVALEGANLGTWDYHIAEGKIICNERSHLLLGFTPGEAPKDIEFWSDLIHPEDFPIVDKTLNDHFEGKTPFYECEVRMKHKKGYWIWLYDRGKVIERDAKGDALRICGTHLDITNQRMIEADRQRLISAIEQSAEIVMITDIDGRIEYVNPTFEKITGYTMSEVLGRNPNILNSGEQPKAFYADLWNTITGAQTWHGKMKNRTKDGSYFLEEATISPVTNNDGKIVNFVAVKHNITREVEIEQQLRHSQKLHSIGQLTGGVAHDFNNLLQVINGHSGILLDMVDKDSKYRFNIEEINLAGDKAARLVSQLLSFSRREVMHLEIQNFNLTVQEMLKMLRRVIGENIELEFSPSQSLHPVRADRGMVEQVLMNLCINARDAMPDGGELTIETWNFDASENFCDNHEGTETGPFVVLSIRDNGLGMNTEVLEQAMEPFFTTKADGQGTGLGLSTVYGILRQHNGAIDIKSTPGNGTHTLTYWPAAVKQDEEAKAPQSAEKGTQGNETILLAEDDPSVARLAKTLLKRAGYKILTAQDGQEAFSTFLDHKDDIDLLLFDVVMPRMSGIEAYETIAKIAPDIPVIFASGYNKELNEACGLDGNHHRIISKPFNSTLLLKTIRDVVGS